MTPMTDKDYAELRQLLADEAAGMLSDAEARRLDALLERAGQPHPEDYMMAAGLAQAGFLKGDPRGLEPMPARVRERIATEAAGFFARRGGRG